MEFNEISLKSAAPLISCLCVTKRTLIEIKGAISCFFSQTYPSKELIIVHDGGDPEVSEYVLNLQTIDANDGIFYYESHANQKLSLGELRNLSIEKSTGAYFCQWDDDDWYHSERLEMQMHFAMSNYQRSTLLTNLIIFDKSKDQAFLSTFRFWENSLLCSREVFERGLKYPPLPQGEDSFFINELIEKYSFFPLVAPYLYIYNIHEFNTWPRAHYDGLISRAKPLSSDLSEIIRDVVTGEFSCTEGSKLLKSPEVMGKLKYFNSINFNNKQLANYRAKIL